MGYRSNVRCVIYSNGDNAEAEYEKLKVLLNTTFKDVINEWNGSFRFVDSKHIVDFDCDDVKWYESYPEVSGFMKMLGDLADLEYVWEFVRVGEDDDDIERLTSGDTNGYLCTSTAINAYY